MKKLFLLILVCLIFLFQLSFALNFAVFPSENFDVDSSGLVRYRPLNNTWLNFSGNGVSTNANVDLGAIPWGNRTLALWINQNGNHTGGQFEIQRSRPLEFGLFANGTRNNQFYMQKAANTSNFIFVVASANDSISPSIGQCITPSITLPIRRWLFVVGVFNFSESPTTRLYVDGSLNVTTQCTSTFSEYPLKTTGGIGGSRLSSGEFFNGSVDEVRIYNRTLNGTEINDLYSAGRTTNKTIISDGQVVYWSLESNQGNRTFDYATNNTGILKNFSFGNTPVWTSDGINLTTKGYQTQLNLTNITNALIFWQNGTIMDQNLTVNTTQNIMLNFTNNETFYVLENFLNVTEGISRTYSPLWFSVNDSGSRHIASNLTDIINATVIINLDCNSGNVLNQVNYRSNSGNYTATYSSFNCVNDYVALYVIGIEPSTSSNVLTLLYSSAVSNQPSSGASTTGGGIFSGSQSGFSTAFMCNKTYDFLVLNKGNYTVNDLSALKLKIESLLGFSIQQSVIDSYVKNYNAICSSPLLNILNLSSNPLKTFIPSIFSTEESNDASTTGYLVPLTILFIIMFFGGIQLAKRKIRKKNKIGDE